MCLCRIDFSFAKKVHELFTSCIAPSFVCDEDLHRI